MSSFRPGQRVAVRGESGTVRFVGRTQFSPGSWVGVELDASSGKNDGSVAGIRYFRCQKTDGLFGVFVRPTLVVLDPLSEASEPSNQQVSELHSIIDRLQTKLRSTTGDIRQYRDRVNQLQASLDAQNASLEMLTTDNDFLTDQVEDLRRQLRALQGKYDEIRTDHDLLREETDLNRQLEAAIRANPGDVAPADLDLLVLRNKQLETALESLRKLSDETSASHQEEITSLRAEAALARSSMAALASSKEKLQAAEYTIESLQTQLDLALALEEIIEHLTSENEALRAKVAQLTVSVTELTELHELDKSLEESQARTEAKLKDDILSLLKVILDDKQLIADLERKNKYLEAKFSEYKAQSRESRGPEPVDSEEVNLLNTQLESVRLELRKFKTSSFSDKLSLRLAESQLRLLHDYDCSNYTGNLQQGHRVLYLVHLNMEYATILLETIESLFDSEISYQTTTLINIKVNINFLVSLLTSLAHLWEFNWATKHFIKISEQMKQYLSVLNENLTIYTNLVKEGDIENISCSPMKHFIKDAFKLLRFTFVTDTHYVIFQNISLFQTLVASVLHESTEGVYIIKEVLAFVESFAVSEDSEESQYALDIIEKINYISEVTNTILADARLTVETLKAAKDKSKDLTIKVPEGLILDNVGVAFNILIKILKKIDLENFSLQDGSGQGAEVLKEIFGFNEKQWKWKSLEQIILSLSTNKVFLKSQFELYEKQAQSIYDSVGNESFNSSFDDSMDTSMHLDLKSTDLSNKLLEKDSRIQDLELNVQLLEKNMASSNAKSKEHIDKHKKDLMNLRMEHDATKKNYETLLAANKELELEIQELLKSSQMFESSHLMRQFKDLKSQKKYTEEMALIEEVMVLRKMVNFKYNSASVHRSDSEEYKWLEQPIQHTSPPPASRGVEFRNTSSKLRNLAKEARPIQLPNRTGAWRPKTNIPKYMNSLLEEKRQQYQHERNTSISSSFN